jgi:hypothetical protein
MSVVTASIADTIHLKNGTVIEGTIIREIPDVSVAIETAQGKVFTYNMQDVFKIDRRPSRPVPRISPLPTIRKDPTLSGLLSAVVPGAGQVYNNQYLKGGGFFLATVIGGGTTLNAVYWHKTDGLRVVKGKRVQLIGVGLMTAIIYTGGITDAVAWSKMINYLNEQDATKRPSIGINRTPHGWLATLSVRF